jgi:hypothetical protein
MTEQSERLQQAILDFEDEVERDIDAYLNNNGRFLKRLHLERAKALGYDEVKIARLWVEALHRKRASFFGSPTQPKADPEPKDTARKAILSELIRRQFGNAVPKPKPEEEEPEEEPEELEPEQPEEREEPEEAAQAKPPPVSRERLGTLTLTLPLLPISAPAPAPGPFCVVIVGKLPR